MLWGALAAIRCAHHALQLQCPMKQIVTSTTVSAAQWPISSTRAAVQPPAPVALPAFSRAPHGPHVSRFPNPTNNLFAPTDPPAPGLALCSVFTFAWDAGLSSVWDRWQLERRQRKRARGVQYDKDQDMEDLGTMLYDGLAEDRMLVPRGGGSGSSSSSSSISSTGGSGSWIGSGTGGAEAAGQGGEGQGPAGPSGRGDAGTAAGGGAGLTAATGAALQEDAGGQGGSNGAPSPGRGPRA